MQNSEDIRWKKRITETKMDDINKTIKKRFEMTEQKADKELKKIRENMMKQHDESKNANTLVQNANL